MAFGLDDQGDLVARYLANSLIAYSLMLVPNGAYSQDISGLFGTWTLTGASRYEKPECGNAFLTGEVQVLQRITSSEYEAYEAYDGRITSTISYENCDESLDEDMGVHLFVNGDQVTVVYEDQDREQNVLAKNGNVLDVFWSESGFFHWEKTAEASDVDRASEARKNIAQTGYDKGANSLRTVLISRGQKVSDVEDTLWQYYDRNASCQVDSMIEVAAETSVSFYEMANMIDPQTGGATNVVMVDVFDTGDYNSRALSCVENLKIELGINQAK